ncbi:MAG: DEAD/DEAH box helicase [Tannerella sp.]|jgi:superfamily II DNA or RNA helicase|nr:DEAD/DEAH box helicase [Tannerella sp.]
MNQLLKLQQRIKHSKLYKTGRIERLYMIYGRQTRDIKTSVWFEVVNDRLTVFVRVENTRINLYDDVTAAEYKTEIERQFYEIINNCELERKQVPLHERLRDDVVPVYDDTSMLHQVDALRFCCSMKVSALYADTGTGKSKIAIDLVISRYEAGQIKKALVFLPVSTKKNFQDQIDLWGKDYPQIEWRLVGHESMGSCNKVVLETYSFVDSETQIIIDESHMIKSPSAKRSKRIRVVCEKTSYKLVMTGTPVTDNVHNLFMQYAVLSPLIIGFRDWMKFEERYLVLGGRLGNEVIGYKNIDYLMGLLEPYTYQIDKKDCLNLPAKQYFTHTCDMTDGQWERYIAEKDRLLRTIESDDFTATDVFQAFIRMQQICSGYTLSRGEKIPLKSNRLALFEHIPPDEKTIIFCKYIFETELLVEFFGRQKCSIFTGQNPKERDAELTEFVTGDKQYFVATMQSGGTGLNGLQEVCRRMIFFSNSFSYFHRKQSVGRIDRQGQKNEMFIHDFRTNANIDDKIMRNLRRKGNLSDEIEKLMGDKSKLKKYIESLYVSKKKHLHL